MKAVPRWYRRFGLLSSGARKVLFQDRSSRPFPIAIVVSIPVTALLVWLKSALLS